jgi:hypothetical protein
MELIDRLEELEDDLAARAFLFEHPTTYREAVESAMEAVRAMIATEMAVA